jgi:hypothetical protein
MTDESLDTSAGATSLGSAVQAAAAVRPRRLARRAGVDILLLVLGLVSFLGSLSIGTALHLSADDTIIATGLAHIDSCVRDGPVSRSGLGFWYTCHAEVSWHNGHRSGITARGSAFTPADIGHAIRIEEHEARNRDGGRLGSDFLPAGTKASTGAFVLVFLAMIVGIGLLIRPVIDVGIVVRRVVRAVSSR